MLRIQDDDLDACGLLYKRYKKMLFSYFYNNTRDANSSEDLVQITFEKVIKYRKKFAASGTFKSWIFSIARNAFFDSYRKKSRFMTDRIGEFEHSLVDDQKTEEANLMQKEEVALLHDAIKRLSPEKREILSLIKLEEMKYKEVAARFGVKESTLKVRVFRIMKELKDHLIDLESRS